MTYKVFQICECDDADCGQDGKWLPHDYREDWEFGEVLLIFHGCEVPSDCVEVVNSGDGWNLYRVDPHGEEGIE